MAKTFTVLSKLQGKAGSLQDRVEDLRIEFVPYSLGFDSLEMFVRDKRTSLLRQRRATKFEWFEING